MEGASELAEAKRGTKGKAGPGSVYWITLGPDKGKTGLGNLQVTI